MRDKLENAIKRYAQSDIGWNEMLDNLCDLYYSDKGEPINEKIGEKTVKAICTSQYMDEDDLYNYRNGVISFNEIFHYEVGKEYTVYRDSYDKNYFKIKSGYI